MEAPRAPICVHCSKRHLLSLPCWRGRYSTSRKRHVLALKGHTCWLCGGPDADTVDHVIPRSRGGLDTDDNLMPAHRQCNVSRGAVLIDEHALRVASTALVNGSRRWLPERPAARPATGTRGRR